MRKNNLFIIISILLILLSLQPVLADLMAFEANIFDSSGDPVNGNITVEIWDAASSGNLIYNSTNDFLNNVTDGKVDITLGGSTQAVPLNLTYGDTYYMEVYINNNDINFSGFDRQEFQSSVGNITSSFLNFTTSIVPDDNNTLDLGSPSTYFSNLYAATLNFLTQITTSQIANNAITSALIAARTITIDDIADSSVNTSIIVDRTITRDDIADDTINTTNILDATITEDDILANNLTGTVLQDRTLTTNDLADSAVNTSIILDATINSDDLSLNNLTISIFPNDIGFWSDSSVLLLNNETSIINTTHILDNTITTEDILLGTINESDISTSSDLSINNLSIGNVLSAAANATFDQDVIIKGVLFGGSPFEIGDNLTVTQDLTVYDNITTRSTIIADYLRPNLNSVVEIQNLTIIQDIRVLGGSYLGTFTIQDDLIIGNNNISSIFSGLGTLSPEFLLHLNISNSANETVTELLALEKSTSDVSNGTAGIGSGILFRAEDSIGEIENISMISGILENAGNGTERGALVFYTGYGNQDGTISNLSSSEAMRIEANANVSIDGDLAVRRTLHAIENTTFDQDVVIKGSLFGGSPLDIGDNVTITQDLTVYDNITTRSTIITDYLRPNANAVIELQNLSIIQDIRVLGNSYLGTLTFTDNGTFPDSILVDFIFPESSGAVSFQSLTNFIGNVSFSDNLTVDGDTFYVDASSNRVGIGTTSPTDLLTVYDGNVNFSTGSQIGFFYQNSTGRVGIGVTSPQGMLEISNLSALSVPWLNITDGGNGTKFIIDTAGNVGIGTANPNGLIDSYAVGTSNTKSSLLLSGQEFYTDSTTSTDGVAFILGVNRVNNRQLWIGDSANLAKNSTNRVIRINTGITIDSIATDGTTKYQLSLGNSEGVSLSGNVGIGTTAPANPLQVEAATAIIRLNSSTTTNAAYSQYDNAATGGDVLAGIDSSAGGTLFVDTTPYAAVIGHQGTYDTQFATANTVRMTINGSTGNVGIGTTSPGNFIHVSKSQNGGTVVQIENANTGASTTSQLQLSSSSQTWALQAFGSGVASTGNMFTIRDSTAGANRFTIENVTGNIGIGTTTPIGTLSVFDGGNIGSITLLRQADGALVNWRAGANSDGHFYIAEGNNLPAFDATDTAMMIAYDTHNVGIGTTSPTHLLNIYGTGGFNITDSTSELLFDTGLNGSGSNPVLQIGSSSNVYSDLLFAPAGSPQMRIRGSSYGLAIEDLSGANNANLNIGFPDTGLQEGLWVNGSVGIGTTSPTAGVELDLEGNAECDGVGCWAEESDIAYKENIRDLDYGLNTILQLSPKRFNLKETGENSFGLIAQEVEPIIPEIVDGEEGSKNIGYSALTPILINAIREQQKIIEAQEARLAALESQQQPDTQPSPDKQPSSTKSLKNLSQTLHPNY